jgi:hypothetical protein
MADGRTASGADAPTPEGYLASLGPIAPARYVVAMDGVPQRDGSMRDEPDYPITTLLSEAEANKKLALSEASDAYLTVGLSLAPSTRNGLATRTGKPIDFCPHATACRAICLNDSGMGRVHWTIHRARVASRLWVRDPVAFKARLVRELIRARDRARRAGKTLVVRLNVFSDIVWERMFPELFTMFGDVVFYDYTKVPGRQGKTPANYHITFSRSESNEDMALAQLGAGHSVSVVFEDHTFPPTWHGFPVIDGTTTDLRFLDPSGVAVGLAEKDTEMHGPQYAGKRNMSIPTAGFVLATATSDYHGQGLPPL